MVLVMVLLSIGIGVTGQLLLKMGANTPVHNPGDLLRNLLSPTTIVALFMYVVASLLWIAVLSRARLSYAYPLLGLNYALIVLLSVVILHESVSLYRWIGVGFIVLGFIVTATS
jgi:multidrug transporter EmrE-like cation transporter